LTLRAGFRLDCNVMGNVHQLILQRGLAEARKQASGDASDRLCVEAAYEVLSDEEGRIGLVHAGFAMTALPHKRIGEPVWERDGGQVKCSSKAASISASCRSVYRMARSRA
jgi:hypothetical protein